MYTASMSCETTEAILAIDTHKEDEQPRLNTSSDIDLSLKRNHLFLQKRYSHQSCEMIACHGVAESNESDDIVLSSCEVETQHVCKDRWFVCQIRLSPPDTQHDFKEVLDLVYLLRRVQFEKPSGEKQLQQRKVIGRKQRKRGSMKAKGLHKHRKTRHQSLIGERTSEPCTQRQRKKCCVLKCYRMFKCKVFLVSINLRAASNTSNDEDAEQSTEELCLKFCFKTKTFSHFYLCGSKKFHVQSGIVLYNKTDDDMTDYAEIEMATEKTSFNEAFENVLQCRVFRDCLNDNRENVLQNVLQTDVSADSSIQVDKNVLHNDVSADSSIQVDKNVLHNDVSADSSIQVDKNVLHNDVSADSSIQVDKNVLHTNVSADSSIQVDKNVLHNDVSADSSIQVVKNVLHIDVSADSSVQVVKNVLRIDVSADSSVQVDKNVLQTDVSADSYIQVDKNVLHNDVSADSSIQVDKNVLHNDVSADSSIQVDKNDIPVDWHGLHIEECGNISVTIKNISHNFSGDSSVTIERVSHNLSGDSSVTIERVSHNLSGDNSIKICGHYLCNDSAENNWLEICVSVSPNDVSESRSVDTVLHSSSDGSTVKISANNLHNNLLEDSLESVKTIGNNRHDGLFEDSLKSVKINTNNCQDGLFEDSLKSVKINRNNHHDGLFEDSLKSVKINRNNHHDGLFEDSLKSVKINRNNHHDGLFEDSLKSVKINRNNHHDGLFEDSLKSVKINRNNHHDGLFEDSLKSVKINTNNCHDGLFEDSLKSVKINRNNRHDGLFKDCLESVKINRNNRHDGFFDDNLESVKIPQNMFEDALFEDSTIKMSKIFHSKKFNISNTHDTKAADSVDWWLNSSGIDDIRSSMDFLRLVGIHPRCSHSLPMFWQEITLYPFTRGNSPPGDLHQLMCYEVFRLCSFSYARFPADFDVWVTRLAQAGFYCENEIGRIVCFHCGCEFRGTVGSAIEGAHHPDCQRHEHSRPLHVWTEGLNQETLAVYYNRYGSLRPYNFEVSNQQRLSDDAYSAHEGRQGSAVSEPQAQSEEASGEEAAGEQASGSPASSGGRELGIPVLAEVAREDSTIEEAVRPEYHSEILPAELGETRPDHGFGDQQQSLPGNLNEVSGAIVSEESQDTPRSYQILTSAAKNPMPFYNAAARGSHSQAEDRNENGAVGGAGVTLDLSKASYPLFSSAEARRQTFTAWSRTHSHRPEDLVAAGFFYAGYADCVRCFCCGLGLKYWRPNDIPAYQHARYRPHCVYNRLYKGQDYIDRVQQDLLHEQGTTEQLAEAVPPAQGEAMTAVVARPARVLDESAPAVGTPSVTAPNPPDLMNSEVAQEAMRNGWDRSQVQQAVDHIVREFGVHCLEISLLLDVLTNLNMDIPEANLPSGGSVGSADSGINERAVLPGTAAAEIVNVVGVGRGVDVADVADTVHGEAHEPSQARAVPIQQPAVPPIEFNELFRSVEREHTLLAERTTCRLCRRRPVSCIYLPCGHVIACQECADNATHCILCSKQIIGTANIYLA